MDPSSEHVRDDQPILVLGGTGKTGRRVAEKLRARDVPVRIGSRSGVPRFDWQDSSSWEPALQGTAAVYVTYQPDLALRGAADAVGSLARLAVENSVRRLVLLSGRGEKGAERSEEALRSSGADWTILRASWFSQNFSESYFLESVLGGEVALPVGEVGEPFIDADDIADVAVAALADDSHVGEVYELTGPRLLTFEEATLEVARASSRPIRFVSISPEAFADGLQAQGVPDEITALMIELFTEVLDGRNSHVTDDVLRVLGREPRDFAEYARQAAATGVWSRSWAGSAF